MKFFSESSQIIDTHIDVVVEVLEVYISASLQFFLDGKFIEFLWDDLMFEIPHATNFCRVPTI